MKEESTVSKIGQDFTFPQLLRFCFPSILTQLFTQLFKSLDDGLFVSRFVGKSALAGINILNPLLFFQFGLSNLFAIGGSNISSRRMGQGNKQEARRIFSRIVISAFLFGALFSSLVNIFSGPLLRFFGADEELAGYAILSLRSIFLITPIILVNNVFNSYYAPAGKPGMGLFCSLLNGSINIACDVYLIVILKMGVLGACLSTVIGDVAVFIVGVIFYCNQKNDIYFVNPAGNIVPTTWEAWKNGFPQTINSISLSITAFIINSQLLRFVGSDGIAANSIITDLRRILTATFFGYTSCVGPIISYHYGARDYKRIKKVMNQNITFWIGGFLLLCTAGLLLRKPLISIFIAADQAAVSQSFFDLTFFGLTLEFLTIPFFSGNTILSRLFIAANLQSTSFMLAIVRNLVFRVILLAVLPELLGGTGIWLASPGCEFCTFLFGLYLFFRNSRRFGYHFAFVKHPRANE